MFGGAEVAPGKVLGIDEEALNLWVNVGAPRDRVIPVPGLKENFWAMGDTGPCGPCSEIHYDMGPSASDKGHTDCKFGCECGRYVEIWNLVFMQFNRDASGTVAPLPKPSIDTGAGLERLAAVLQGKISNFDTDLFMPLIERAAELTGTRPGASAAKRRFPAHHRGPCPRIDVSDFGRRDSFQRRPRIRTAKDYPSRDSPWAVARRELSRSWPRCLARFTRRCAALIPSSTTRSNASRRIILAEETRFAHTIAIGL